MDLYKILMRGNGGQVSMEEAWCVVEQYIIDLTGSPPRNVKLSNKHQMNQLSHAFGVAKTFFLENRVNLALASQRLNKNK